MDDKKIHEQSLVLAKQLIEKDPSLRDWVVSKFPELRESEDERIRKEIESVIRVYGKTQGEWIAGYDMDTLVVHLREAFGALEKQKEFLHISKTCKENPDSFTDDDKKIRKDIINLIYWLKANPSLCSQYYKDRYNSILAWLEKQKEQKPIIKGWVARDKALQLNFYTNKPKRGKTYWIENGGDSVQIMPDPEHLYEEQAFDTLDWKDEPIEVELVVKASTEKRQEHVPENEGTGTRQEQKPVEWSEEDEKMLKSIIEDVTPVGECPDYPTDDEREYYYNGQDKTNWLKDLPNRFRPHWKPSEEQMEALHTAVYLKEMQFYGGLKDKLRELYKQLTTQKEND